LWKHSGNIIRSMSGAGPSAVCSGATATYAYVPEGGACNDVSVS